MPEDFSYMLLTPLRVSQDGFVKDVNEVVTVGQAVKAFVISKDVEKKKIGLSLIAVSGAGCLFAIRSLKLHCRS